VKSFKELREKTLTAAEKKKREEIAKAIEKDEPDMPMDKKMAIATAQAKKVAEGAEKYTVKKGNMTRKVDGATADKMKRQGWKLIATEGLEEGKMKDFHDMVKKGMTAAQIAKKIGMKEKDVADFMKGMKESVELEEKMKDKPYEKQIGMGDSRSEKEIRDQISGLSDGTLKKWASKPAGRFGSKIAKLQDKVVAAEMKKRGLKESVEEARKDSSADLYFNTYSAAVQHAKAQAEKKGFEVVEDDWFNQVTTGKGKPGRGKTTRHTLKLTKNDKPVRKSLSIQVYNRDTDKNPYELNFYVS